jgi:YidC/Oxa1 family membrane protein insertase
VSLFKELSEVVRYFNSSKINKEITFYSENAIYFQYYKGTIDSILKRTNFTILYISSDIDDPLLKISENRIKVFYINKLVAFVFPFITTKILVLTMTDLGKYHIKRSVNDVNHVYMFHAINSIHMQYNLDAFNHYDTIFCVGEHHVNEIRESEKLYNLNRKKLVKVGYSWLEDIESNFNNFKSGNIKILIAPTWSTGNIFETCIEVILEKLSPLQHEIILRPHPEFIKRHSFKFEQIYNKYKNYSNILFDNKSFSSDHIFESNILITDWSGIAIEYAWGMLKPVIYIDTPKKINNPNYKDLKIIPLEDKIRDLNGRILTISQCESIDIVVQESLKSKNNINNLINLREKYIFNWGKSSQVAANYIKDFCEPK